VILPQFCLAKLKLEYSNFGFKCKKKDTNTGEENLHHSGSTLFEFSLSLLLEYGRKIGLKNKNNDQCKPNLLLTSSQAAAKPRFTRNHVSPVISLH